MPFLSSVGRRLTLADVGTRVRVSSTSAVNIKGLVPTEADVAWPDGAWVEIVYIGGTLTTISVEGEIGVTLNYLANGNSTLKAGEYCRLTKVSGVANTWDMHIYGVPVGAANNQVLIGYQGTGTTSSANFTYDPVAGALSLNSGAVTAGGTVLLSSGVYRLTSTSLPVGESTFSLSSGGVTLLGGSEADTFNASNITVQSGNAVDGVPGSLYLGAGDIRPTFSGGNTGGWVRIASGAAWINPGDVMPSATRSGSIEFLIGPTRAMLISSTGAIWFGNASIMDPGFILMSTGLGSSPTWVQQPQARPYGVSTMTDALLALGIPTDVGAAGLQNVYHRSEASTDVTYTVQPDASFTGTDAWWGANAMSSPMEVGGVVYFSKHRAGNVIIAAGVGVTINTPSSLTITKLHGKATLIKVGPNEWDLEGSLL
jgi:hypothetical protein